MDLGGKVKEARKAAKLTQQQLGDAIGVSRESIANYERGKFQVSIDALAKIAMAAGVPLSWFFRDGYSEPRPRSLALIRAKDLKESVKVMMAVVDLLVFGLYKKSREDDAVETWAKVSNNVASDIQSFTELLPLLLDEDEA